ncbi:MAG: flagellar filament capping protein FliD [Terracidiphilus sp.]
MGTVGLSFGSPTSGAGFDVSTTVAEIVGNLQKVETPWQMQLTTLESQDTAISSLGTLFSNVSNDMSSLTDLQGILAEKTGSSSDTNALELTAASSAATAGTHTVMVNSLAQTSSGYMAPIADPSDTLAGSITLAVGSGTAQTIALDSSDNTLSGLASAINSSGLGITANVLTDASGSRLSLVSGTSGAGGNIAVSNNSIAAAVSNTLSYSGTAGTDASGSVPATTSSGTLSAVESTDQLGGSISIQVGSGSPVTVEMSDVESAMGGTTIGDLATYLQNNDSSLVTAQAVTNSDGTSSLSLTSATAGSAGTLTVNSGLTDSQTALAYASTVTGQNASLTVDGVNLTSASNTVANLIPGVTFQLLATSSDPVQVIIGNDNTDVESTVNQFVSDYNSLMSAMNTQEGNDSSGHPEPLFGSPTLTLLQQQLLGGINLQNPNGYLTPVSAAAGTTLTGSMTVQVGSGAAQTIVIGAGTSGNGTIYTGSGVDTLSGLASAINSANIGVTAAVATSDGQSTLTLTSQTAGASGALTVTSSLATNPANLTYTDAGNYTSTTADSGTLGEAANGADTLSGYLTIAVGGGAAQQVNVGDSSTPDTIYGLADAINDAGIGVTAAVVDNSDGSLSLSLESGTDGSAGALTVTSSVTDTTTTPLDYTQSSDINNLTSLGIGVNNDGSLTFDAASLDSVLNSNYSSVVGFFQNANSWGQSFSSMLTNAGSSSSTGILALASGSNSSIESTLNAEITREGSLISAEQTSLTAELNSANEIMQQLPTQLEGVNELYSAITGYDQNLNG